MKNHWKTWGRKLAGGTSLAVLCLGLSFSTAAQNEEGLDELDFIEMVNTVDLGNKSKFIQDFQDAEAKGELLKAYNRKNKGFEECNVELYRNKEVILITIPAKYLFDPNEKDLKSNVEPYLKPIKRYLKNPDTYRVLLVMHTDNTGNPRYRDELTEDRVEAVFEWFEGQGCDTSYMFPYAMGDDMPLPGNEENDSQAKRDENRRLEIYLVPGTKMLEQAKKGRIAF